jgi:glycosyltransferase involved in cell wall biosynthesis
MRKHILFVGDGPDCPSGFGLATRKIAEHLDYRQQGQHEVTVLGINHLGDPGGTVPYPVYAAMPGGDAFGVGRLIWMCDKVKPDLIILQNDPWNIPRYIERLKLIPKYATVPRIGVIPVDGLNCYGKGLNDFVLTVFWTDFALREARRGGFTGDAQVIPLGVDTEIYRPIDRYGARFQRGLPKEMDDAFIVGNVNRNQPRKRLDLTLKYFAEWVRRYDVKDAHLYLHVAPTGDRGIRVANMAQYYGILDRLALREPPVFYGDSEDDMVATYNCFDVCMTTTQGEGFGLTTLEAMACGVPTIVPDWAALGDWACEASYLVPCTSTHVGEPYVDVIGGVADEEAFISALQMFYADRSIRESHRQAGLQVTGHPRYQWSTIGHQWAALVEQVFHHADHEVGARVS